MFIVFAMAAHVLSQVPGVPDRAWLVVGQSTCSGWDATSPDISAQVYGNTRQGGFYWWNASVPREMPIVPLNNTAICDDRAAHAGYYPCTTNYGGPNRGLGDALAATDGKARHIIVASVGGTNYNPYFKKGAVGEYAYTYALAGLQLYSAATNGAGFIEGVFFCQGEGDWNTPISTYKGYLEEWRSNLEADVQALLPRNRGHTLVFYLNQFSSCGLLGGNISCTGILSIQGMNQIFVEQPEKFRMLGPMYWGQHVNGTVHPNAASNKRRGVKGAEAWLWEQSHPGQTWKPLYGTGAEALASHVYRITYHVPFPPIVNACPGEITDTPYAGADGGWFLQEEKPASNFYQVNVSSWSICTGAGVPHADCQNSSQVIVVPASWDTGAVSRWLRYADVPVGTTGGPVTGQRGCVRDSDSTFTVDGAVNYNYAIHQYWTF